MAPRDWGATALTGTGHGPQSVRMVTNTPRGTTAGAAPVGATGRSAPAGLLIDWRSVGLAERACCCPSRPAFIVALPAPAGRLYATELLLCGHHYRKSRAALAAAGATIVERGGAPVTPHQAWADE
jgi:hypothetical protein